MIQYSQINILHLQTEELKDIVISIDAEKSCEKVQHLLWQKSPESG